MRNNWTINTKHSNLQKHQKFSDVFVFSDVFAKTSENLKHQNFNIYDIFEGNSIKQFTKI